MNTAYMVSALMELIMDLILAACLIDSSHIADSAWLLHMQDWL